MTIIHPILCLTPAEQRIARLVSMGLTNPQIALEINVSSRTVDSHVYNILKKTGAKNRVQIGLILTKVLEPRIELKEAAINLLRKRKLKVKQLIKSGLKPIEVAEQLGIHYQTVSRTGRLINKKCLPP